MKRLGMLGVVLLLGVLSACGGGSGSGSGSATNVTVKTTSGKPGTYLTDGNGIALYMFAADKRGGKSTCYNSCASIWPPLLTKGAPKAAGQAKKGLLGTITRSDGSTEVTYNGWPLYYYAQDNDPGDLRGQGIDNSGGLWWVLSPDGTPIKN